MSIEAAPGSASAATGAGTVPGTGITGARSLPIRMRLALWCAAILAVGLLCCSTLVYLLANHALRAAGDDRLTSRARRIDAVLQSTAGTSDPRWLANALSIFSPSTIDFALLGAQGQVVQETPRLSPAFAGQARYHLHDGHSFYDQVVSDEQFRSYLQSLPNGGPVAYVLVAHSIDETLTTLSTLRDLLLGGDLLCLTGVSVAAWLLAHRALAPIDTITRTAATIARSADSDRRVPVPPRLDEVGRLATTFNAMLASLAESQAGLRSFVSDASHELRAPITSIRGNADLLAMAPHMPLDERVATARDISEEAAWLSRLVDGLLALAIGDARLPFQAQPVALHDLLRSNCRTWASRPGPAVRLGDCDRAVIMADPVRMDQLLTILLDNATKYTPPEGVVLCTLRVAADRAEIAVADTGAGIHPDDVPHIFERFYRAARRLEGAPIGARLGLAIARQIVDEAGGSIEVKTDLGRGTTFVVRLPLASTRPEQAMKGDSIA